MAQAAIDKALVGDVKLKDVMALKARLLKESSSLAARKFGKREISLQYRGLEVKINAETIAAELDLRTACTLKARLASCGKVVPLDFENEILRMPGPELANSTPLTHDDGSLSLGMAFAGAF